ncbi:MAG: ribonuclease P protein component [Kiloniellaceae bacterium]
MMPIVGRLKKRPDFLKVAAARAKWVTPGLILQARPRPRREPTTAGKSAREKPGEADAVRVGFTVTRKIGNAVRRNRARRRLRAVAAEVLPVCGRPGFDYVLIGRSGTLDRPFAALLDDLRSALKRVTRAERGASTTAGPTRKGAMHE